MCGERGKGVLRMLILGIIILRGRTHGYEVFKELRRLAELAGCKWNPSLGTIYRFLNEMVDEGLIIKTEITKGKRSIACYEPTEKGVEEFIKAGRVFLNKMYISLKLLITIFHKLRARGRDVEDLECLLTRIQKLLGEGKEIDVCKKD